MEYSAILHVPKSCFAFPEDEKTLVIRLRVKKNEPLSEILLLYGDRVDEEEPLRLNHLPMEYIGNTPFHTWYEARIEDFVPRVCYLFKLHESSGEEIYYSEHGFSHTPLIERAKLFQFPYIRREDIISLSGRMYNRTMYHIYPDSFSDGKFCLNGNGKKDDIRILPKDSKFEIISKSKNGGTLRGIEYSIPYIKSLGASCIYLNPVFLANSPHKYDTADYFMIDPNFGTNEDLISLVKACHENDILVILDGVFNHTGTCFFAFRDILKNGRESEYCDWYYDMEFSHTDGRLISYKKFAYVDEMPKLNTGNPAVREYFYEVAAFWTKNADIDGWRLDVANEVDHSFWRGFRDAVRSVKKDAFFIGEIWENATAWLLGDQFDSAMNYMFSYLCTDFFAKREIDAIEFSERITEMYLRYEKAVSLSQMNFLDTHDTKRFYSFCKEDERRLFLSVFFLFTAPGIPSVFYGDECFVSGLTEDEYRKPMPWDKIKDKNNSSIKKLREKISYLSALRREHESISMGAYKTLYANKDNFFVFLRESDDEKAMIYINNNDASFDTDKIKDKDSLFSHLPENIPEMEGGIVFI